MVVTTRIWHVVIGEPKSVVPLGISGAGSIENLVGGTLR